MKPERLPDRIVSLVPSLTEALFALGLGDRVVGATDWCVHPADALALVPRVGGTKDPDLAAIAKLRPELVIANREENTRRTVVQLEAARIPVWVTYPRTVAEGARLLRELALLGGRSAELDRVVGPVEQAVEGALREVPSERVRVFCPIWKDPWMAVGADTYAHDLIELCGGRNVFGRVETRRYPIVREAEIVAAAPEVILLPDEPYAFGAEHAVALRALPVPAAASGRIHCVDGTLLTWYGPRIRRAIELLRSLLSPDARL
ncbi:MAG: ABC transporter substrate-binding protein [Myxococcales bacterium]|nr:MAG: ABC transporter substrate-binding protein [Myxococcales bacterium]